MRFVFLLSMASLLCAATSAAPPFVMSRRGNIANTVGSKTRVDPSKRKKFVLKGVMNGEDIKVDCGSSFLPNSKAMKKDVKDVMNGENNNVFDGGNENGRPLSRQWDICKSSSDESSFSVMTIDHDTGETRGFIQKDGVIYDVLQKQGEDLKMTESAKVNHTWTCGNSHENDGLGEVKTPPIIHGPAGSRGLHNHDDHHHDHEDDHSHGHHHDDHKDHHHHYENHSDIQQAIELEGVKLRGTKVRHGRKLYYTDTYPAEYSYQVNVFVEVDQALVDQQGSWQNLLTYIDSLVAGANIIFEKEIDTTLVIDDVFLTDRYEGIPDRSQGLAALRSARGGANWPTGANLVHALLAIDWGGGLAGEGVICDENFGHGVSSSLIGAYNGPGSAQMVDINIFTHEIGHNFGSKHTHDVAGYNPLVDNCGNDYTCPGITNGAATIMSYCHQCQSSNGYGNIANSFGGYRTAANTWTNDPGVQAGGFSVNSYRVAETMYNHVSTRGACVVPDQPVTLQTCTQDSDCDDGKICNGVETCNLSTNTCEEGTPHNCPDDGVFCNGPEVCNPISDQCESSGNPCDDGNFCNGAELCFEDETCGFGTLSCTEVTHATPGGNAIYGIKAYFYDIEAKRDILITGFRYSVIGSGNLQVYYRSGTGDGFTTSSSGWTGIVSPVSASGTQEVRFTGIQVASGTKASFHVYHEGGIYARDQEFSGAAWTPYDGNADLTVMHNWAVPTLFDPNSFYGQLNAVDIEIIYEVPNVPFVAPPSSAPSIMPSSGPSVLAANPNFCALDSDCDDGNVCNGDEVCSGNLCQPGTPVCSEIEFSTGGTPYWVDIPAYFYDIEAKRDILITGFRYTVQNAGNLEVHYRSGSGKGFTSSSSGWTEIVPPVSVSGTQQVSFTGIHSTGIQIASGEKASFHVYNTGAIRAVQERFEGSEWTPYVGNTDLTVMHNWAVVAPFSSTYYGQFNAVSIEIIYQITTTESTSEPSMMPSLIPSYMPSSLPSRLPSSAPSLEPSGIPSLEPSVVPSLHPSLQPSLDPTSLPSSSPSSMPSSDPSSQPSLEPSFMPSLMPSSQPSSDPSSQPSLMPSSQPSSDPSSQPSLMPSSEPNLLPSAIPNTSPSLQPSLEPSSQPSLMPSSVPSSQPSSQPSLIPSSVPSSQPSSQPSLIPSIIPSSDPSSQPSLIPSSVPSSQPSSQPSLIPSSIPSSDPSSHPSLIPSSQPSWGPSLMPSLMPSFMPSSEPSSMPSMTPSNQPSLEPTSKPSTKPSSTPSLEPSAMPSLEPSSKPSLRPSAMPSSMPIFQVSSIPSVMPSNIPSSNSSSVPSLSSEPSATPSMASSSKPSIEPSAIPSLQPSSKPSIEPSTIPSLEPSAMPSLRPSSKPSTDPTSMPSSIPSTIPSTAPSLMPSFQPSFKPSHGPSAMPSFQPSSMPSSKPSSLPSMAPSSMPSFQPSLMPSLEPSAMPSLKPSSQPSLEPSSEPSSRPSLSPSHMPSSLPSSQPSFIPSQTPSSNPSSEPSSMPSIEPVTMPSSMPIVQASSAPSIMASQAPSVMESNAPSVIPSLAPSAMPSMQPSFMPSSEPSVIPSLQPSTKPSIEPSSMPSTMPSNQPSSLPSSTPSYVPSIEASDAPSIKASGAPSITFSPSLQASNGPSAKASAAPSVKVSNSPSIELSSEPSIPGGGGCEVIDVDLAEGESGVLSIVEVEDGALVSVEATVDGTEKIQIDWGCDGTFMSPVPKTTNLTPPKSPGVYPLCVKPSGCSSTVSATSDFIAPFYIVVYDPSAGYVAGRGTIDSPPGAVKEAGIAYGIPYIGGKARFGFQSKYNKGASIPSGKTNFNFKAGGLSFQSTVYEWLVVSGDKKAKFKGEGLLNKDLECTFIITATENDNPEKDEFRIQIWKKGGNQGSIYDNMVGTKAASCSDSCMDGVSIESGEIKIQRPKGKSNLFQQRKKVKKNKTK